ncbi:MAG: ClpXP protease specificity-enhancing factor [Herbaspirillum sp.]
MSEISTKPYLLRAIYEWCTDNGYTPYIAAVVDANTRVPTQFVQNGEIVLNISFEATSGLKLENESIRFNARFGGVARDILVPVDNVIAIYARENGQGMAFEATKSIGGDINPVPASPPSSETRPVIGTPTLASVPTADSFSDSSNPEPEPPKKGGPPKLTRIK